MGVSRSQRERVALRQQAVLDAYAMYGTIAKACEVAGVPRSEHYRWQKGKRYAARFAEAEEQSIQALETEARRRALVGTEKPLFHKGNQIGNVPVFSDPLLMFLLKAKRPEVYRDRGLPTRAAPPDASASSSDAGLLTRISSATLEQALAEITDP